jgi:hypothetical protein
MNLLATLLAFLRGLPWLGGLLKGSAIAAGTAIHMNERHARRDAERAAEANRKMLEVAQQDEAAALKRLDEGSI